MKIAVKTIVDEWYQDYKVPSMFIAFPHCGFKCEHESGVACCQNSSLAKAPTFQINIEDVVSRYLSNPITKAVVFGGLEPLDDYEQMLNLVAELREHTADDIVIYTGYTRDECEERGWLETLRNYPNIIIKFGRFIPNSTPRQDDVLGLILASENQFAMKIS